MDNKQDGAAAVADETLRKLLPLLSGINPRQALEIAAEFDRREAVHTANYETLVAALTTTTQERDAARAQVFGLMGAGGLHEHAPAEMYISGDPMYGCDAWLYLQRMAMDENGPVGDYANAVKSGALTPPVRYVRADLIPALPTQTPEP